MSERIFDLSGVACGGCTQAIADKLETSATPVKATFDLSTKTMTVDSALDDAAIIRLVEEAGYGAAPQAV